MKKSKLEKGLHKALFECIETNCIKCRHVELYQENKRLRNALELLLSDTQHSDHDCGDIKCPVELARKVLKI